MLVRFLLNPWGKAFLIAFVLTLSAVGVSVFTYYYQQYARIIEEKLRDGPFANTSLLYAAPQPVDAGRQTPSRMRSRTICGAAAIRNRTATGWAGITCGRTRSRSIRGRTRTIRKARCIKIERRQRSRRSFRCAITPSARSIDLEPELITNLFDQKREKRRHRALRRYSAR